MPQSAQRSVILRTMDIPRDGTMIELTIYCPAGNGARVRAALGRDLEIHPSGWMHGPDGRPVELLRGRFPGFAWTPVQEVAIQHLGQAREIYQAQISHHDTLYDVY